MSTEFLLLPEDDLVDAELLGDDLSQDEITRELTFDCDDYSYDS